MNSVTPPTIAYIAVLLRSALSTDAKFIASMTQQPGLFKYHEFYQRIIHWFADEEYAEEVAEIMNLWNRRFFLAAVDEAPEAALDSTESMMAAAKKARNARKAAAAGDDGA